MTTEQTTRRAPRTEAVDDEAVAPASELPLTLQLRPVLDLTDDQFFQLCQINRDVRIERSARGELLVMPPTGLGTGDRNARITMQLTLWSLDNGTGTAFDSSTGFTLPNGAVRSPDAAWIRQARLDQIPPDHREKFAPLCPDFVIELRSPTDALSVVQAKMEEYIDNGAQLGWLIDPRFRHVYVYRPSVQVERLDNPATVSGEPVLPGFELSLRAIW